MQRLKKVEAVVEKILDMRTDTRESDDILYLCVCEYFHRGVSSMTLKDFLKSRKDTGCPNFETVRRTRQKFLKKDQNLSLRRLQSLERIWKMFMLIML